MPNKTSLGREISISVDSSKVIMYVPPSHKWGGGKESKKITINRFVLLDDLFFEGLGLWVGEGGKGKGLYFGNTSPALLLQFIKFVEEKVGLDRRMFKVTINSPQREGDLKEKWSRILQIHTRNFTDVCLDVRINHEYAQIYLNSIILTEFMKNLQEKLKPIILSTRGYAIPLEECSQLKDRLP